MVNEVHNENAENYNLEHDQSYFPPDELVFGSCIENVDQKVCSHEQGIQAFDEDRNAPGLDGQNQNDLDHHHHVD